MSVSETAPEVASPSAWTPRRLLSDARLVRLAQRGDQRAFEAIFERYHQELYRYCRAILRDPDEAQDALQSTMASALRSLPGDQRQIALRPWLYRVAHNEAISILRQRAGTQEPDQLPDPIAPGADLEAEGRERLRTLVADLDQLPERQRGALVMRELSGLSYSEIGLAIASTEAAARQAVYEARVGLRELSQGREMECETARRAVSERDGRLLRSRRLRAHLRACEACQGFHAAISQRRDDLRVLCPPLPAVVASGLLSSALGGAATGGVGSVSGALTGGGAAGVAGGTTLAGPIAVKGASLAAAVAIGAGAAGISGVVEVPVIGDRDAQPAPRSTATPATTHGEQPAATARAHGEQPAATARGRGHRGTTLNSGRGRQGASADPGARGQGRSGEPGEAGRHGGGGSASHGTAPASNTGGGDLPASSNGKPPTHSAAGGNPPGQAGASTGAGSHGKPAAPPGLERAASNAPSLPEQARGKPGAPPGHSAASNPPGSSSAARGSAAPPGSPGAHGSAAAHRASGKPQPK
jgi:RNA polymerase sigma factor (sigma-70 family)